MPDCDKPASTCSTQDDHCLESQAACKPCAPAACCPVEKAVEMWSGAFCQAMTAVQVDILKEKIKKSWGRQMDDVGNAITEAMGIQWQTMLTQAKSQVDLRDNIKSIFLSNQK